MSLMAAALHATHCDPDAAQAWMATICGPHQLEVRRPARLSFEHDGLRLPGMGTVLGRVAYGTDVTIAVGALSRLDGYSISLPISGRQMLHGPQGSLRSDRRQGLIVSPSTPQALELTGSCRKWQVVIRREALQQVAEQWLQRPVQGAVEFEPRMDLGNPQVAAWWQLVAQLCRDFAAGRLLFAQGALARELETLLIRGLLLAQPNDLSPLLAATGADERPAYLQRACRYIAEHAREEIGLGDLEAAAGVSRQRLYDAFHRHLGNTPMGYLRQQRLLAVRAALLAPRPAASVSAAALEWGFSHLGRFAADYRKVFGETPSQTLECARQRC